MKRWRYTQTERSTLDGNTWTIVGYFPEGTGFLVVGADFAPNGQLYLLERKLMPIHHLPLAADGSPETHEVLWASRNGEYYKLEGISVWPDGPRATPDHGLGQQQRSRRYRLDDSDH